MKRRPGRPKKEQRRLYNPEVEKCLVGGTAYEIPWFSIRNDEWEATYLTFGRSINPILAKLILEILCSRNTDSRTKAEVFAKESLRECGTKWNPIEIETLAMQFEDENRSNLVRLKTAFGAAILCEDVNFIEDVALIVRTFSGDPSFSSAFAEFFTVYWAAVRANLRFGNVSEKTVNQILAEDGDDFAFSKQLRKRLKSLGVLGRKPERN